MAMRKMIMMAHPVLNIHSKMRMLTVPCLLSLFSACGRLFAEPDLATRHDDLDATVLQKNRLFEPLSGKLYERKGDEPFRVDFMINGE
jgi:hypothetical protein